MNNKKILLILLMFSLFISIFAVNNKDSRKTLLIYSRGYSFLSTKVEHKLKEALINQGKYRLVERDINVMNEIERILHGLTSKDNFNLNQLAADYIVYIEVIDAESYRKTDEYDNIWYEYHIEGAYRLIDIETSQILEIKTIDAVGTHYVSQYVSEYEAKEMAREEAISSLVNTLVYRMNKLFLISGKIIGIEGNSRVLVNIGRNNGVYKGMMFSFAKNYEINGDVYRKTSGKLVTKEVSSNSAILEILEEPEFALDNTVSVIENPDISPFRAHFSLSMTTKLPDIYSLRMDFLIDNYKNFTYGVFVEFSDDINTFYTSTGLNIRYTPEYTFGNLNLGADLYISSYYNTEIDYNEDYIADVGIGITPIIGLELKPHKNFGIIIESGYTFESSIGGNYPANNAPYIKAGIDLIF
ncbi:hypothetical protein [Marinitoga sp. 1138]|uniref:hypothetical protein n=1 Tax=Marinitoga sp. 1138 TaxID=1643334 RepID=UPI00158673A8|nr:hypothetical protein [Marinitoga sp. 1138]NUU97530.1 hypothetical protein [Marinitoga sp. 1138]